MWSYTSLELHAVVNLIWIYWLASNFARIDPETIQIVDLLFLTTKKEVCLLYKPMPVMNRNGNLVGIIGYRLEKGITLVITKN
jgi:hypothetical protein